MVPLDKKYHNLNVGSDNKKAFGHLFGGDCYVIQYTYHVNGRENHMIYYWLVGRKYIPPREDLCLGVKLKNSWKYQFFEQIIDYFLGTLVAFSETVNLYK